MEAVPLELQGEQYDVVLIYNSQHDEELALNVQAFFQEILPVLQDGNRPRVCVFANGDLIHVNGVFSQLEEGVRRSTYIMPLLTKNFVQDNWCQLANENCLMEALYNPKKRWCLVPLFNAPKRNIDFEIPLSLKAINGIHLNQLFQNVMHFSDVTDYNNTPPVPRKCQQLVNLFNERMHYKQERQRLQQHAISEHLVRQAELAHVNQHSRDDQGPDNRITTNANRTRLSNRNLGPYISQNSATHAIGAGPNEVSHSESTLDDANHIMPYQQSASNANENIVISSQPTDCSNTEDAGSSISLDTLTLNPNESENQQVDTHLKKPISPPSDTRLKIPISAPTDTQLPISPPSGTELERPISPPADPHSSSRFISSPSTDSRSAAEFTISASTSSDIAKAKVGDGVDSQDISGSAVDSSAHACVRGPVTLEEHEVKQVLNSRTQPLGKGGCGTVSQGTYRGRPVAVKVLKNNKASLVQFSKEKAVAFLRHPYILPVIAMSGDSTRGQMVVVSPLKEAGDLGHVLQNPADLPSTCCTWNDLLRVASQVAHALNFLHTPQPGARQPIRHGDLKPANILLDCHGNACLGDAGLALELPRDRGDVTATDCQGTHDYVDPDSSRCKAPHNDVYAFGILLEQVLTMRVGESYREYRETLMNTGGRTVQNIVSHSHAVWGSEPVRTRLAQLVLQCVQHPGTRISTRTLAAQLQALARESGVLETFSQDTCVMCQFYSPDMMKRSSSCACTTPRFCTGCLRYTGVNPLVCPVCSHCQPAVGGDALYAVLVAGGGEDCHVFMQDVQRLHNSLSDPRVLGIRESNMYCLYSDRQYCKDDTYLSTADNVLAKIDEIGRTITTRGQGERAVVILYVSCHSREGAHAWQLRDTLECESVRMRLNQLHARLLLTIVDCCFASQPVLPFHHAHAHPTRNLVQWSAASGQEKAQYKDRGGSEFTRTLLYGLNGKRVCPAGSRDCDACAQLHESARRDGCILLHELQEYVSEHMRMLRIPHTPRMEFAGADSKLRLAWYNATPVTTKVWFERAGGGARLVLLDHSLDEMRQLRRVQLATARKLKELPGVLSAEEASLSENALHARVVFMHITYKGARHVITEFQALRDLHERFETLHCLVLPQAPITSG